MRLAYGTPTNMASYIKKSLQAKKSLRATLKSHPADLYDKETVEKFMNSFFLKEVEVLISLKGKIPGSSIMALLTNYLC